MVQSLVANIVLNKVGHTVTPFNMDARAFPRYSANYSHRGARLNAN